MGLNTYLKDSVASFDFAKLFELELDRCITVAVVNRNSIPLEMLAKQLLEGLKSGEYTIAEKEIYAFPANYDGGYDNDEEDEKSGPVTKKQIGYLSGLCRTLKIDRHDLPKEISPRRSDSDDLTEGQAINVIDILIKMKDALPSK